MTDRPELAPRTIWKSSTRARRELRQLLGTALLAELLAPSKRFGLAARTLEDVIVLDNRTGGFSSLEPDWGQRPIWLTEVLYQLLLAETQITLVRPPGEGERFAGLLERMARNLGRPEAVRDLPTEVLPKTTLLSEHFLLAGRCEIREPELILTDEAITFYTSPPEIERAWSEWSTFSGETP